MKIGVQIFGCLQECKKNPDEFFRKLAEAGYSEVEPCVFFDDPVQILKNAKQKGDVFAEKFVEVIWKPDELPGYIEKMRQYGLRLSSTHVIASDMTDAASKMLETAKINHIKTYVVNCNQQTITSEYKTFASQCQRLAQTFQPHGIELWIHNNATEIKSKIHHNGKQVSVLTAVLDLCKEANVGAQIDVGWVLFAGIDPVEYLNEVREFVKSIHFKDLKKDFLHRKGADIFACLGDGVLNSKEILDWAEANSNIPVLVDQDFSEADILMDLRKSAQLVNSYCNS